MESGSNQPSVFHCPPDAAALGRNEIGLPITDSRRRHTVSSPRLPLPAPLDASTSRTSNEGRPSYRAVFRHRLTSCMPWIFIHSMTPEPAYQHKNPRREHQRGQVNQSLHFPVLRVGTRNDQSVLAVPFACYARDRTEHQPDVVVWPPSRHVPDKSAHERRNVRPPEERLEQQHLKRAETARLQDPAPRRQPQRPGLGIDQPRILHHRLKNSGLLLYITKPSIEIRHRTHPSEKI